MKVQLEHPADEIKRLQRCINDLVSLLALPAMWSGSKPCDIVHTLLDSLLRMLDLDFVYVSLTNLVDAAPSETVRVAQSQEQMFRPRELCAFLDRWLGDDPQKRYLQERSHIGGEEVSLVSWPLGVQREIGVIVAGSGRADFPRDTEALLLGIAANQALTGLQQARLLTEQKRIADELDQRVAQRTAELAAANEVLRKEVAERRRAEEALAASEHNLRLMVDSIPGLVSLLSPAGDVECVNPQLVEYSGRTLEELRHWGTSDTFHAEDLSCVVQLFSRSMASGNPYDFEARLRRFDGVYRWFHVRGLPLRDANGRIFRWCSLLTDIDDRKRETTPRNDRLGSFSSGRSQSVMQICRSDRRCRLPLWCVSDRLAWTDIHERRGAFPSRQLHRSDRRAACELRRRAVRNSSIRKEAGDSGGYSVGSTLGRVLVSKACAGLWPEVGVEYSDMLSAGE